MEVYSEEEIQQLEGSDALEQGMFLAITQNDREAFLQAVKERYRPRILHPLAEKYLLDTVSIKSLDGPMEFHGFGAARKTVSFLVFRLLMCGESTMGADIISWCFPLRLVGSYPCPLRNIRTEAEKSPKGSAIRTMQALNSFGAAWRMRTVFLRLTNCFPFRQAYASLRTVRVTTVWTR